MREVERVREATARIDILALIARSGAALDRGSADEFSSLFADDASLSASGTPDSWQGRDAIRAHVAQQLRSRGSAIATTLYTNTVIDFTNGGETASTVTTAVEFTAGARAVVAHGRRIRHELSHSGERWEVRKRTESEVWNFEVPSAVVSVALPDGFQSEQSAS